MINKLFSLLLIGIMFSSCGNKGSKVHPVSSFTPSLYKEVTNFNPHFSQPTEVDKWYGVNFVNDVSSNIKLPDIDFKFKKAGFKTKAEIAAAPFISDNRLFILDKQNNAYCFDLAEKKKIWQTNLSLADNNNLIFSGGLTVDKDRVYITNNTKELIVLEKDTGYEVSRVKLTDIIFNPAVCDEKNVYVIVGGNQVFAFDKENLSLNWQVGGVENNTNVASNNFTQALILEDSLIVPSITGDVIRVEKNNGSLLWHYTAVENNILAPKSLYSNISAQMLIDSNSITLPYAQGIFAKLDISNGLPVWQKSIYDVLSLNRFGNFIVLNTNAQQVVALSEETGQVVWSIDLLEPAQKKSYSLLTPVMFNDVINVFSSQGKLYQVSPEGSLLKEIKIPKDAEFYAVWGQNIYLFAGKHIWIN